MIKLQVLDQFSFIASVLVRSCDFPLLYGLWQTCRIPRLDLRFSHTFTRMTIGNGFSFADLSES